MNTTRARIVLAAAWLALAAAASALEAGDPAPDFQARSVVGDGQVALHALRGKVVLVDFWASWCAPCNAAMPQLEALSKEFPADQFAIVGVNVDTKLADARRALERRGVSYPNASDPEGKLPKRFGLETMPSSYLIDREGVVRFVHRGFRGGDIEKLRAQVRKLVSMKSGARS